MCDAGWIASRSTARAEEAEAAIQKVREKHIPHECDMATRHIACPIMHDGVCLNVGHCAECGRPAPCPTIRILDGAE